MEAKQGSLIVVGGGINIGPQTTLSAKAHIEHADIVLTGVTGQLAARWIDELNDNVVSLTQFYAQGKSRLKTYHQMIDTICDKVREGLRVCVVLYGHPGVFAMPAHKAIAILREEGYKATMDPGVSAEDCLVADLGIDPGATGCQAFETTQFLFYKRQLDPGCLVILWQISLAGEHTLCTLKDDECQRGLQVLTDELMAYYPEDHEVILYEATTMAIVQPRIERMPLKELPKCKPTMSSTLVIPSLGMPAFDEETLAKLGLTKEDVLDALEV